MTLSQLAKRIAAILFWCAAAALTLYVCMPIILVSAILLVAFVTSPVGGLITCILIVTAFGALRQA